MPTATTPPCSITAPPNYGDTLNSWDASDDCLPDPICGDAGGFTNEVQHVDFLNPAAGRLASPAVHCFMVDAAVKGDPQERGARAHP